MKALVRFVSRTVCHSSTVYSSGRLRMFVPALLTRMSSRPKRSTAFWTISRHEASDRTSTLTMSARAPAAPSSFTASVLLPTFRAASTTAAPARASPRAIPRPIPPFPPVTIATLPVRSKSFMWSISLWRSRPSRGGEGRECRGGRPQEVQAEAGHRQRDAGEQAHPERLADHVLAAGDHVAPRWDVGGHAHPQEPEDRLRQHRVGEDEGALDQER